MTRKQITTAFAIVSDVKRILAHRPFPGSFVELTAPLNLVQMALFARTEALGLWVPYDQLAAPLKY